jgi:D-sedoheptulose 7-phosphate isomerase
MTQHGSDYDRLFYPFLFEGGKSSVEEVLARVRHSTLEKCRDVIDLRRATLDQNRERIVTAGRVMASAFAAGATLFAFGNGGSTTDVQDLVAELLDPPRLVENYTGSPLPTRPLPAIALTSDIAVITAVGNDVGFENVFSR